MHSQIRALAGPQFVACNTWLICTDLLKSNAAQNWNGYSMINPEHWLNRKRFILYSIVSLLMLLLYFGALFFHSDFVISNGISLISDFRIFWAASHLALTGHALDAYNSTKLWDAVSALDKSAVEGRFGWFYPPTFYLVILPLATLPYLTSYFIFMTSTFVGYVAVFHQIIRDRLALWGLAGFSGVWINVMDGQNGFLTAAIAGAALLFLRERPILSGVFIGLLSIKPQLAILFPVALCAIGAWRTILTAGVVATILMSMSVTVLGPETFMAWLKGIGQARTMCLESDTIAIVMPTVFSALRLAGISIAWAYAMHFTIAAIVAVMVWRIWRYSKNHAIQNAALMTATFLVSPYIYFYDMTWLALAIAWVAKSGIEEGWLPGDRVTLVAVWLLPIALFTIAWFTNVQIGPVVLLILLVKIMRRSRINARPA